MVTGRRSVRRLGASFVVNNIDTTTAARIRDGAVVDARGNVGLSASQNLNVNAVAIGFAGGGSGSSKLAIQIAGAGSGTGNEINGTIDASIIASQVTSRTGSLSLSALDDSDIRAVAGAIAGGGAGGGQGIGVAGAIGLSVAENAINNQVTANIDGGTINTLSGVTASAVENATITAITVGGALAIGVGQSAGVAVAAGGAGSGNRISNTVEAAVTGASTITSSGGGVSLTAEDDSHITAVSVGAALALSSGRASVAVPIGAAVAVNRIANTIHAGIDNSTVSNLGGAISIQANDNADIDAVAVAATLSIAPGQTGAIGVSGGGAGAENFILTTTTATIDNSTLTGVHVIGIDAKSDAQIDAVITTVAGAGVFGKNAGVGVAIGVAAARNFIGYDKLDNVPSDFTSHQRPTSLTFGTTVKVEDGPLKGNVFRYLGNNVSNGNGIDLANADYGDVRVWEQVNLSEVASGVQAFVRDTAISSNGVLTVGANSTADISSTVISVAIAISGGGDTAVAAGVGGAFTSNKIKQNVKAFVDGAANKDMTFAGVAINADDTSKITADTAAGVLSGAFGKYTSVSVAFGLAVAQNEIANDVAAYIVNADSLTTTGGDVNAQAHSDNNIDALSLAISIAPSFGPQGVAVAVAGGGAVAINVDLTQTNAYLATSDIVSAGGVLLNATNDSDIDATVVMTSLAVAIGKVAGVGVSIGAAAAENHIGFKVNGDRVAPGPRLTFSIRASTRQDRSHSAPLPTRSSTPRSEPVRRRSRPRRPFLAARSPSAVPARGRAIRSRSTPRRSSMATVRRASRRRISRSMPATLRPFALRPAASRSRETSP